MALQVDPVHEPERPERFLAQFAGEKARRLVAELGDAFIDQRLVIVVVAVHTVSLVYARRHATAGFAAHCSNVFIFLKRIIFDIFILLWTIPEPPMGQKKGLRRQP